MTFCFILTIEPARAEQTPVIFLALMGSGWMQVNTDLLKQGGSSREYTRTAKTALHWEDLRELCRSLEYLWLRRATYTFIRLQLGAAGLLHIRLLFVAVGASAMSSPLPGIGVFRRQVSYTAGSTRRRTQLCRTFFRAIFCPLQTDTLQPPTPIYSGIQQRRRRTYC